MKNYITTMKHGIAIKPVMAVLVMLLATGGCKKPEPGKEATAMGAMSAHSGIYIDIQDMVAKLPKTVLYNIGDSAIMYSGLSQWKQTDSSLMLRVPLNMDGNTYLYGIKNFNNPSQTYAYIVRFEPDSGATGQRPFSGKQLCLNLQDWTVYGVHFTDGKYDKHLQPIKIAEPDWEQCRLENNGFATDANGYIIMKDDTAGANTAVVPMGGNHSGRCPPVNPPDPIFKG